MAEIHAGEQIARDFQINHESQMTRDTRPRAASDQLRDRLAIEAWVKAYKQGIVKATVINIHAFPLQVNLGYLGYMNVPARKPGEPFAKFIIDKPKQDMRDLGDARFMPEMVSPIELATEFVREYGEMTGGVLAYVGTEDPDPDDLGKAMEGQTAYYWREYGMGRDIWAQRRRHDLISTRQRDAARALLERGLIEKPEWLDRRVDEGDRKEVECEACGTTRSRIAKWCTFCKFIVDPKWVLDHKSQVPRDIYEAASQVDLDDEVDEELPPAVVVQQAKVGNEPKGVIDLSNLPKADRR